MSQWVSDWVIYPTRKDPYLALTRGGAKKCTQGENSLMILSHNIQTVLAISANFGHISACWISKACTWAEKFIGDTFKHFQALLHTVSCTLSHNFTQLLEIFTHFPCNLDYFSYFWANFNMFSIKSDILKLKNSYKVIFINDIEYFITPSALPLLPNSVNN